MGYILIGSENLVGGTLQPGAEVGYNRDGSISGTATYTHPRGGAPSISVGSPHPRDSRAKVSGMTVRDDETVTVVSATYAGVWSTAAYSVDVQVSSIADPIETHPQFTSALAGTVDAPLKSAIFSDDGSFVGWPGNAPSNLGGVRSWLRPAVTVRCTGTTSDPAAMIAGLAKVGSTTSSLQFGSLQKNASYSFALCTSFTYSETNVGDSSIFVYTIEWTFTSAPGWNPLVYNQSL